MAYELHRSTHDLNRLHNPWEKFKNRKQPLHVAEDSRPSEQTTTTDIIEAFLTRDKLRLDKQVPRRRQILRDFLDEVVQLPRSAVNPHFDDIARHSKDVDVAFIDDRQNHERCAKNIGIPCNDCHIFSQVLKIPELCQRLRKKVSLP